MNPEEIWASILEEIAQKTSKPSFDTWFKTTKAVDLNEVCLRIEVENEFQKNWLYQRFLNEINQIKNNFLPKEVEVVFTVKMKAETTDMKKAVPPRNQFEQLLIMMEKLQVRVDYLEEEIKQLKS